MFCRNCQTIIPDDSIFCENCGAPTGLDPDRIDDSNLVPEEAVEFEVVKDEEPLRTSSVPVDPVWWEPPAGEDEPIDIEIGEGPSDGDFFWHGDAGETEAEAETETDTEIEAETEPGTEAEAKDEAAGRRPKRSASDDFGERSGDDTADGSAAPEYAEEPDGDDEAGEDSLKQLAGETAAKAIDGAKAAWSALGAAGKKIAQNLVKEDVSDPAQSTEEDKLKPYAQKAKVLLEDLGKTVRTGPGRAAEAAKEQYQLRKEEYEERKEQRDQQREEEKKARDLAQRRKENERLRQMERQKEEELAAQRDVVQQTGFWYGDEMPEPTIAFEPARKVTAASEEKESKEKEKTASQRAGDETSEHPQEDTGEDKPEDTASQQAGEETSEPLPQMVIEDKLADTARFAWSAEDMKAAAAAGEGSSAASDSASDTGSEADASSAAEDPEAAYVRSPEPEDEPALYRIKDFDAPVVRPKRQFRINKGILKLLAVIVAVLIVIAVIAGAAMRQAQEKQMEEEAYQNSLATANQLVKDAKYQDAEAKYLSLMEQRPEDVNPYIGLAQMYIRQERYVDAEALIERAIEATQDRETFAQMQKNLKVLTSTEWKGLYAKVLEDNESDIRRYEEDVSASTALCDVNGDLKPELFFFTKEYYGYGKLHIYTTVNEEVKEVSYDCRNRGTQYQDAFYDISSDDSSYAVFNSSEPGKFSIYANVVHDGSSWDTTNEYKLNLKGGCKQTTVIEGSLKPTYEEGEEDASEYLQDDESISYDKYIAEFKRVLDEATQVILYNGSGGDQAVWMKVKPDSVMCMSYDDMMTDLEAD